MEQSYYFVASSLPPLFFEKKPEMSFQEVKDLYKANLSLKDFQKVQKLLHLVDLYNVRAVWLGMPLDERGNLREPQFEEALLVQEALPEYLVAYMERYESIADRLRFFPSLYASLFSEGVQERGFLGRYFRLEREIRLVLAALRGKTAKRDLLQEFQFEDPLDPFVAHILAQKDAPEYTPPFGYEGLKAVFDTYKNSPKELHLAILRVRFHKLEEIEEKGPFSMDALLGYLARLYLIETWWQLDEEKGRETIETLSDYG